MTDCFEYDVRTLDDLEHSLDLNYSVFLEPIFNKDYILNLYRNDWIYFKLIPIYTAEKIARIAGLDIEKVMHYRNNR